MKETAPENECQDLFSGMIDDIDKACGLRDLLTAGDVAVFSESLHQLGLDVFGITEKDGSVFYHSPYVTSENFSKIVRYFNKKEGITGKTINTGKVQMFISPIEHDFEEIGFLWTGMTASALKKPVAIERISMLMMALLDAQIRSSYKLFLTSTVHAQVVEESYDALKEKNFQLQQSEKKYRELAQSLDAEVKRKAREIETVNTQLMQQEKMASIGQLAAGVAHEINNPIGFVSSNLGSLNSYCQDIVDIMKEYRETLMKYTGYDGDMIKISDIKKDLERLSDAEKKMDLDYLLEDLSGMIDESKEGVNRVKKIVQDLKDFAHPGQETPAYADINKNIDSTLNIVWNELKYKVTVKKDYGNIPPFHCYPRQLNQVFMNIFINASHAIQESGEIEIRTRALEEGIEISIRDSGSGIPPENLKKIFDPFFTTKAVGKGTGLGLNLSYNIVRKHQGTIEVFSDVGQGTTFVIKLPYLEEL